MSSQLEDDTKYVKLLLLLLKGGTYVFKKHIQKILDSENTTIDICLKTHRDQLFNAFKGKVINRKLWELLDPDSEQPKDVDVWDISSLAYVLLNIFDARLNVGEKVAINKLRDKRNELVHRGDSSLQEEDFLREWSRLTKVLYQLSTGLSSNDQDFVNKLIEDISAIKHPDKAIDDLKLFRMEDDLVKDVLAKQQGIYERRTRLEELIQSTCELEIRSKEIDKLANTRPPGLDELTQHICALEEIKGNPKRESDEWSHFLGALKEIKRIVKSGQLESDERSHIVGAFKDFKQIVESGPLARYPGLDELWQHICALEEIKGNPERGPLVKTFVFRYQYLLLEVGKTVLRKVFDRIVGPDVKVYLENNPDRQRDFNKLLSSKHKPTPQEIQLLPPIDNTPSSDKFDIRLLFCLLRHVCGLCPPSDQVWLNPQPTDKRLEAYITRLRRCINELAHKESVLEDETVLSTKWDELCMILQGLSIFTGFSSLQQLIARAEVLEIDEVKKESFENAIKEWQHEIGEVTTLPTTVGLPEETLKQHGDKIAALFTKVGTLEESKTQHDDDIATLSTTVGDLEECTNTTGLDELCQRICALEKIKRNPESGQLEISARITASSSTQTACDEAHHKLLEAAKRCLTDGHVNHDSDEVFTVCYNMFTDMSTDGASIKKVEEGSVWITLSCWTFTCLKSAFLYLTRTVYIRVLQDLEAALSRTVGRRVKLIVDIALERLSSMLGIEENNFAVRYQYLLTEVATSVLTKVFDHIVVPNFKVYLDNNLDRKRDFDKLLLSRNKPSPQQLQLLPPIDNTPSSDNFDSRLLFCLLRHVCGLCPPSDQVWLNPQATDNRVEAYITRLRHFRNELVDNRSMLESVTLLTTKWNKLCEILQELASYSEFGNWQEEIRKAESIEVDDQLTETIEEAINAWQRERYEILQRRCSNVGFTILQPIQNEYQRQELKKRIKDWEDEIFELKVEMGDLK